MSGEIQGLTKMNGGQIAEPMLECLRGPAIVISDDYRIVAANSAYTAAFGNGTPILGRHCYEVSHRFGVPCGQAGESCPVEHCRRTGEPCRLMHVHHTARGEAHEEVTARPIFGAGGKYRFFLERIEPSPIASARPRADRLVGRSPAFNHMLELVERVAKCDTAVLLLGESGTGKELVAKALHDRSRRASRPFVPVDCSGLSENLFESELFGYEKGAFTGAVGRKRGLVEVADGGTLFLDEIGDIPPPLQVKLLRLLETGGYRRVGSTDQRRADFRLVCATHRNLKRRICEGQFRADLYYRISAFPIPLPPLRERPEDVPLLVRTFRRRLGCNGSCRPRRETLEALSCYDFPGNARELLNIVERACLLADDGELLPEHLPAECLEHRVDRPIDTGGEIVPLEEVEKRYLWWAAARFQGERRELADRLGLSERTFYRKLSKVRPPGVAAASQVARASVPRIGGNASPIGLK